MIPRTMFPSELPTDHRVRRLGRALGVTPDGALAILVRLWCYCSRQLDGGDLVDLDPEDLAHAAEYAGSGSQLAAGLVEALLAVPIDGGLRLVLYRESNDPYLRARAGDIERLRRHRANQKAAESAGKTNADANGDASGSTGLVLSYQEHPPNPPPAGGRQKPSRRPSRRQREADDLIQLGAHRGVPVLDAVELRDQDRRMRDSYRAAAERAAAAGDLTRAAEFNVKADQMDGTIEEAAAAPAPEVA